MGNIVDCYREALRERFVLEDIQGHQALWEWIQQAEPEAALELLGVYKRQKQRLRRLRR